MSEIFTKVENLAKRGIIVEFKEFINRGNVIDLAVGAIFGGQQPDFSKKVLTVNGSDIPFGAFATSALNFFFVALALFMVVKLYNRFRSNDDKEKAALNTNDLLVEIRDELRATRNNGKQ